MDFKASDQYWSMMRSYERLKRVNTDTGNHISNTDARDTTRDFFNNCYHLKDWLKKDPLLHLQTSVEDFISNSTPLSLAADFCNAHKHGGLDRGGRSGKEIERINTHVRMDLTPRGFVASSSLEITISGQKYDAFDLATQCLAEWEKYLGQNGVTFSKP